MPVKYDLSLDLVDKGGVIPVRLARLWGIPPANLVLVDIEHSEVIRHTGRRAETVLCFRNHIFSFSSFSAYVNLPMV